MKLYKLKWLIYYFCYKLNRWLGGKTKWERSDERHYYTLWEFPPSGYSCRCHIVIPEEKNC